MEYNKTKKIMERVAGILSIIAASFCIIFALTFLVEAGLYFGGEYDIYIYDYYLNEYTYIDQSSEGIPFLILGLMLMTNSVLNLIFSIKLVKSPILPNGELRRKQAARIWVLILSVLTLNFVVVGLLIAVLCLKDFKEEAIVENVNSNVVYKPKVISRPEQVNNEFYDFYDKIQEVKKLKDLGIIDDAAYKKAVTKIVTDIIK